MFRIQNCVITLLLIISTYSALGTIPIQLDPEPVIINNTTEPIEPITEINPTTVTPGTSTSKGTTISPNSSTVSPPTTKPPITNATTIAPNSTTAPTTPITKSTTVITTSAPGPNGTTTTTVKTTAVPPTTPVPSHRRFDGPSFIGGIVLALGLVAIGFVAFKFYKARTELNYHTL